MRHNSANRDAVSHFQSSLSFPIYPALLSFLAWTGLPCVGLTGLLLSCELRAWLLVPLRRAGLSMLRLLIAKVCKWFDDDTQKDSLRPKRDEKRE
ncbi:MAG: hypothetical protein ACI8W8_000973 [Rhodothermales bacterium]